MEISAYLRAHSRTIEGKQQLIIGALAKALEIIPRQICDNAGFDATDVLNKLRMRHAMGDIWAGVDIESEGVKDNMEQVRRDLPLVLSLLSFLRYPSSSLLPSSILRPLEPSS